MAVKLIGKLKPYGDFAVADSIDIQCGEFRLDVVLNNATIELGKKATKAYVDEQLSGKVDKVSGKGLSSNDFTTTEKNKLAGLTQVTVDTVLSASSSNAISNMTVKGALDGKAEKSYVDAELAKKATPADISKAVADKADSSTVSALQTTVNGKADTSAVTAVSSRVTDVETEQSALSSRMDSFTKLEEGSTTGDAELIDGRTGSDGTVYNNIGDAIRSQNTQLKNDLTGQYSEISRVESEALKNYKDKYQIHFSEKSGGINSADGTVNDAEAFTHTDFFEIPSGNDLLVSGADTNHRLRLVTYNSDGTFVRCDDYFADQVVSLNHNVNLKYRIMLDVNSPVSYFCVHDYYKLYYSGTRFAGNMYRNTVISTADGTASASTSYYATQYLYVEDLTNIWVRNYRNYCLYDSDKNFISANAVDNTAGANIDVSKAAYIRFTVKTEQVQNWHMYYYRPEWTALQRELYGKVLYGFGDSLVYGHYSEVGILDGLAEKYHMDYHKQAINGARVLGTGDGTIYKQIVNASISINADYVMLDGFTNDAGTATFPEILGEVAIPAESEDIANTEYNTNTFIGSFENLFRAINKRSDAKVFYITPHKMCTRPYNNQYTLFNAVKSVCSKWSIPMINVFENGHINTYIKSMRDKWSYDNAGETTGGNGTHLTGEAYDIYFMPLIEESIKEHMTH